MSGGRIFSNEGQSLLYSSSAVISKIDGNILIDVRQHISKRMSRSVQNSKLRFMDLFLGSQLFFFTRHLQVLESIT